MPKSWRSDPQYMLREDHPDPRMRPSVDHLISQLRRHKALKDRPDSVAFVIKDLSHRFLVRDDQKPDILWGVIRDLMFHFEHLMPPLGQDGFEWVEEQMDMQIERRGVGTGGNEDATLWPDGQPTIGLTPAGDSPEVVSAGRVIMFDSEFMKSGIQGVLVRHRAHEYVQGKMKCRCTKFFSSPEEWANHVRIRIWRFFKNEFPPIPSDDEDGDVHSPGPTDRPHPDTDGNQHSTELQQGDTP